MKNPNEYPIHSEVERTPDYRYACTCGATFYVRKDLHKHLAIESVLKQNLVDLNFSPIYQLNYLGKPWFFQVKCDICGHTYNKRNHIWMYRHTFKHAKGAQNDKA